MSFETFEQAVEKAQELQTIILMEPTSALSSEGMAWRKLLQKSRLAGPCIEVMTKRTRSYEKGCSFVGKEYFLGTSWRYARGPADSYVLWPEIAQSFLYETHWNSARHTPGLWEFEGVTMSDEQDLGPQAWKSTLHYKEWHDRVDRQRELRLFSRWGGEAVYWRVNFRTAPGADLFGDDNPNQSFRWMFNNLLMLRWAEGTLGNPNCLKKKEGNGGK